MAIGLGILLVLLPAAQAASFDCARAASAVEQQICAVPALSARDDRLAELWAQALAAAPDTATAASWRNAQQRWLASRNECRDAGCLAARYDQRNEALACLPAVAATAMGAQQCTGIRLQRAERALAESLQRNSDAGALAALPRWTAERNRRCDRTGREDGGAAGWQRAGSLACRLQATQQRLAAQPTQPAQPADKPASRPHSP